MYKKKFIVFLFTTIISAQSLEDPNTSPLHILGKISKEKQKIESTDSFNPDWVKDLKLLLPCKNIKLPKLKLIIRQILWREDKVIKNEPLFYIYVDGTAEKRIIFE